VNPTELLLSQDDDGTVRESMRWMFAAVRDDKAESAVKLKNFVQSLRAPDVAVSGGSWNNIRLRNGGRFIYASR
jgi:hypothetical protein